MAEPDLFFRIARGREMARAGRPLTRNLFSFTYPDHPYPDPAWLFDGAVAVLYRAGGFPAVVCAKAAVLALAFAVAYVLARRRGATPTVTVALLGGGAWVMRERFVERPHVVSWLGALAVCALADRLRPDVTTRGFVRRAIVLFAVIALWANLHAGAFVAPILLLAYGVGRLAEDPSSLRAHGPRFVTAAAVASAALLVTPVGAGLFTYLAVHVPVVAVHAVDEFRRPDFTNDGVALVFTSGCLALAAAGRAGARALAPALAVAALAAFAVRFLADAALLAAVAAAPALSKRVRSTRVEGSPRTPWFGPAAAGAAVVVAALLTRTGGGLDLAPDLVPAEAVAFVEANHLRDDDSLYNDFELGGYLAFRDYPAHRVFVDARLPAYPLELHRWLGRTDLSRAEWQRVMDRYHIDAALLGYAGINRRVAWWDPERWALVYAQHDARVFVARTPARAALIERNEIPLSFAFTEREGVRSIPLWTPPRGSPVPACEWSARLGDQLLARGDAEDEAVRAYTRALDAAPGCLPKARAAEAAAWVGAVLLRRGRAAVALGYLERALATGNGEAATLANRALALEALGRTGEALVAWRAILTAHPGTDAARAAAARVRARP